jgi:hypothetical protein
MTLAKGILEVAQVGRRSQHDVILDVDLASSMSRLGESSAEYDSAWQRKVKRRAFAVEPDSTIAPDFGQDFSRTKCG